METPENEKFRDSIGTIDKSGKRSGFFLKNRVEFFISTGRM